MYFCFSIRFLDACDKHYQSVVDVLINYPKFNVNFQDRDGKTGFIRACINGHYQIVELLVRHIFNWARAIYVWIAVKKLYQQNHSSKTGILGYFIHCITDLHNTNIFSP